MSISPINNNLATGYVQQIFANAMQSAGAAAQSSSSAAPQSDASGLSPFAQMLTELQQLQQSNPTQYQQVAQQIATNLQSAAQTAQNSGNTTAATELTQLAGDFSSASKNGQLPSIQDLAQALGGHHHHHHGGGGGAGSSSSSSSNDSLSQLVSAFQATQTQNSTLNPLNIILNTLSAAGVTLPGTNS